MTAYDVLLAQALQLSDADRGKLAVRLFQSLDSDEVSEGTVEPIGENEASAEPVGRDIARTELDAPTKRP